ncbi:hypothetical protein KDL45_06840 [bacterium]|nr:hypothetical protein [bacterium]
MPAADYARKGSLTRRLVYVAAAVSVGLLLLEGAARLTEMRYGEKPVDARSPIAFQQVPVKDPYRDESGRRYIQNGEWPGQQVPVEKTSEEFRIVVLGGSAAAGMGVAPPASFAKVMERLLNDAHPDRRVRVVNMAWTGFNSAQQARFLAAHIQGVQPDLVLTVMGNNEFLDMVAVAATNAPSAVIAARKIERRLALARWLMPARDAEPAPTAPSVVDRRIVKQRPDVRAFVAERLGRSLESIRDSAAGVGARVMVSSVAVNQVFGWFESPWPYVDYFGPHIESYARLRWALRYEAPRIAVELAEPILAEDPRDPGRQLIAAWAYAAAGDERRARELLHRARTRLEADQDNGGFDAREGVTYAAVMASLGENDAGFETLSSAWRWVDVETAVDRRSALARAWYELGRYDLAGPMMQALVEEGSEFSRAGSFENGLLASHSARLGLEFFDLADRVSSALPSGIPGYDIFLDYCHYNVRGHLYVGHFLAEAVSDRYLGDGEIRPLDADLREEAKLRAGRLSDLPDLRWWAGADFRVERLVYDPEPGRQWRIRQLEDTIARQGQSAIALTYRGNWYAYHPQSIEETRLEKAAEAYRRALELDPNFEAARANLRHVEWMRR